MEWSTLNLFLGLILGFTSFGLWYKVRHGSLRQHALLIRRVLFGPRDTAHEQYRRRYCKDPHLHVVTLLRESRDLLTVATLRP